MCNLNPSKVGEGNDVLAKMIKIHVDIITCQGFNNTWKVNLRAVSILPNMSKIFERCMF